MRDTSDCGEHGVRAATYVCKHLGDAAVTGRVIGFNCGPSESEGDLRDAWCDGCDRVFVANGMEWTDESPTPDGLSILCSGCYIEARALAGRVNELKVF